MKTIKDIEQAKKTEDSCFGTLYNYWLEYLFDSYIAKLDGQERIDAFLTEFDEEARKVIQADLDKKIEEEE